MREEPEPIAKLNPGVPAPLRWIIERCLSKDVEQRYASTRDLARDLASLRDHLSELSGESAAGVVQPGSAHPTFQRLSFRRGTIVSARFAPDGTTVVYGAAWEGDPCRLFTTRSESPESSPLMLPGRGDPRDLADREPRDLPRAALGGPVHLERHARAGPARGRSAARAARERAVGGLGARRHPPRRRAVGRRQDAARIPDREGALRDGRLDQPSARLAERRPHRVPRPSDPRRRRGGGRRRGSRGKEPGALPGLDHRVRPRVVRRREGGLVHGDARRASRARSGPCRSRAASGCSSVRPASSRSRTRPPTAGSS